VLEQLKRAEERYLQIEALLGSSDVLLKGDLYRDLMKEYNSLTELVEAYRLYQKICSEADAAKALLEEVSLCDALRLRGLMNVAPFGLSALDTERIFADVKGLFDGFSRELKSPCFDTLSMGMSGDFELAIAQGSTLVRIGSAIFGARNY